MALRILIKGYMERKKENFYIEIEGSVWDVEVDVATFGVEGFGGSGHTGFRKVV